MSYVGVEGLGFLEPWTCGPRIAFTALNLQKTKLCKLRLDCRYDACFLWTRHKRDIRDGKLCDDYRHPRFYTVYHDIQNADTSYSEIGRASCRERV